MNKKHIVNIGYPRSGTSWLWRHINHCIGQPLNLIEKENNLLLERPDFDRYVRHFAHYEISLDFQPLLFQVDRFMIAKLCQISTSISVILRNPFELAESWYNWIAWQFGSQESEQKFVEFLFDTKFLCLSENIQRWQAIMDRPLGIFLFDDIKSNPKEFLKKYLEFCDISAELDHGIDYSLPISQNLSKKPFVYSDAHKKSINLEIDLLEPVLNQNLSHWRR